MIYSWDNILESRGLTGVGKSRLFRPGGGRFPDLGKDYAYIRHSHTCTNDNNNRLIDIIMLTSQDVSPYPTDLMGKQMISQLPLVSQHV